MTDQTDSVPQRIKPLEERILEMVNDIPQWDFKVVRELFPNEHEKSIYRALKTLELNSQVRYLGWQGRTKQYTTKGVSNLPAIPVASGNRIDIKTMFPVITQEYDERFVWKRLAKLNTFPLLVGQIFTTAQLDEDQDFKTSYQALMMEFTRYINELRLMLDQAEAIRNHAVMSGDSALFKSIITSDMPSNEDLTAFKVWLSKYIREQENA